MYKVRVILDTKKDVIRTLLVNDTINLEELHLFIAKTFGFNGQEMASFYKADYEWNQGEEIPLFNMSEFGEEISMSTCVLKETLPNTNDKLIYVYDFFKMWSFYVEVIDSNTELLTESKILMSIGEVPDEAPEKEFVADKNEDSFDDEFESLDDIDFDTY
jgi:hypothetical protein